MNTPSNIKVLIAGDHAGFELKKQLIQKMSSIKSIEILDLGTESATSVDYPDYADILCQEYLHLSTSPPLSLSTNSSAVQVFGVLICGSGQGMAMRANKFTSIRAALVYNQEISQLSREHNNAQIICLGAKFCSAEEAFHWIQIFVNTEFSEGRHALRVAKLNTTPT